MPSRDPKSYVKSVPLPIPSQKGLKLQARCDSFLNPYTPTREEVWKCNYDRRKQQLSEQGFYAHIHQPYKAVGDPVYLDNRVMVLSTLGQWDENEQSRAVVAVEPTTEPEPPSLMAFQDAAQVTVNVAKFILKRTKKDLNTLNKEVVKGRAMIRNVQLGHGLFHMIKQERYSKKAAKEAELKRKLERSRTEWQPPRVTSSSDEDTEPEDDLERDSDLENYIDMNFSDDEDSDRGVPSSSGKTDASSSALRRGHLPVSAKPSTTRMLEKKKKKRLLNARPFTPMHTNLTDAFSNKDDISSSALFRQLCSLCWILDAMNIEQNCYMGPISTCWKLVEQEIGGLKIKKNKEKRAETLDWDKWLSNSNINKTGKKISVTRFHRFSRSTKFLANPRMSLQPSLSPSSSSSQVNTLGGAPQYNPRDQLPDSRSETPQPLSESRTDTPQDLEEDSAHKLSVFKFLDEYYDSLRREAQKEEEKLRAAGAEVEAAPADPTLATNDGQKQTIEATSLPKVQNKLNLPADQQEESKDSDSNVTHKSPAETHKQVELSEKYMHLNKNLHNKFKEVQDEKAMTLHDILEQMDRERLAKCQNKFTCLKTKHLSFHRAVDAMRKNGDRMVVRPEDLRRQSSFRGSWYTDLINSLPVEVKDLWYYKIVIQKLGKYGLVMNEDEGVESSSKQSVLKFLKVLEGLRHWEICNPDISAAIEFCRARIVDMSVDDYEVWFTQAFPKIPRPKTAPVSLKNVASVLSMLDSNRTGGIHGDGFGARDFGGAKSSLSMPGAPSGKVRLVHSAFIKRR
ncbi:coiled-coil domain-containing protein 60-like [Physella acuta]|uniref:coiled-coil domain-containing protein 60-like n=1 Tax=Physella acuta TaxID=109671 RepID=UPI0027DC0773|nr:coiled-coil domain-containing protein 60-like [Physella acuta]